MGEKEYPIWAKRGSSLKNGLFERTWPGWLWVVPLRKWPLTLFSRSLFARVSLLNYNQSIFSSLFLLLFLHSNLRSFSPPTRIARQWGKYGGSLDLKGEACSCLTGLATLSSRSDMTLWEKYFLALPCYFRRKPSMNDEFMFSIEVFSLLECNHDSSSLSIVSLLLCAEPKWNVLAWGDSEKQPLYSLSPDHPVLDHLDFLANSKNGRKMETSGDLQGAKRL